MNYAIVFRLLGYVLLIEGALLLLPAAASWIYGEWFVLGVFLITAAVSAAIGYALRGIKPQSKVFYMREGFAATSLSWIVISIVGAVPFVVTGCIPNPVDALFENETPCDGSILTNARQYDACRRAYEAMLHALQGLQLGLTPDAVLTDVEEAMEAMGEVTGATVREDITARIFERFCVGK